MTVSAYVPCYNNAATIRQAIASLQAQTVALGEIVVIDDASNDDSIAQLRGLPVRIVRQDANRGRGAVRALAMQEAKSDLVLSLDATNTILPDFAAQALAWFTDSTVGAVCGRIMQRAPRNTAERWRGRHVFKLGHPACCNRRGSLSTGGALVRVAAVRAVGGYNANLRHGEDVDLGHRLLAWGHDVVCDPALAVCSISTDSVSRVLERYWRWNEADGTTISLRHYFRFLVYSLKVMAWTDLKHGDVAGATVSILCPYYCLFRTLGARRARR